MIAAADVKDQELSIGSVGGRVNHPPITRCRNLSARSGRDGNSLFIPPGSIGSPEFPYLSTIDRQRQPAFGRNKRNRGPHFGRIVKSREAWLGRICGLRLVTGPRRGARAPFRAVARRLKL